MKRRTSNESLNMLSELLVKCMCAYLFWYKNWMMCVYILLQTFNLEIGKKGSGELTSGIL